MYVRDIIPHAYILGHHSLPPNYFSIGHPSLIFMVPYLNALVEFMLPSPFISEHIDSNIALLVA